MQFKDIINGDFRAYSNYNNYRKLPNLVDGLKVSSRKVLYTATKLTADKIKVVGLCSKTVEACNYVHGETSLEGVIVSLARNYTGNPINLLTPIGQFGNCQNKRASSGRYIHTKLDDNFPKYFNKIDLNIMTLLKEEGDIVEPQYFIPKLPMLLLNGAEGIGNGYSCWISSYDEEQVKDQILNYINSNKIEPLKPAIKGYKGNITKNQQTKQICIYGKVIKVNSTTLQIQEVPVDLDLEDVKKRLNILVDDKVIKSYSNHSNGANGWQIDVTASREFCNKTENQILESLKLISKQTETITVWDQNQKLKVYSDVESLLKDWVDFRLTIYDKRKDYLIASLNSTIAWMKVKSEFISLWNSNDLSKMKKKEIYDFLVSNIDKISHEEIEKCLAMRISSLTLESVKTLTNEINTQEKELNKIKKMKSIDFFKEDLK